MLTLRKERLQEFVDILNADAEFIAPVKTDEVRFESVADASQIELGEQALFPAKRFFFPNREVLYTFDGEKFTETLPEAPRRVFFALRRCDLNAIKHQDIAFNADVKDPYYNKRRENTVLIGYHCNSAPTQYCFCDALELEEFSDMMFFDKGDHYVLEVQTEKGHRIADRIRGVCEEKEISITDEDRKIADCKEFKRPENFAAHYDNPKWQKGVDDCLSCAACTMLCPTCYCHTYEDENEWDLKSMQKVREHASCQLRDFTVVAGGHVFRNTREDRFKHRIFHQLQWFKDKHQVDLCVGCGRCITGCPTKIDFVDIINNLESDKA